MPKVKRQPSSEDEEASNSGSGSDAPSPPPAKKGKTAEKTKAKPKKDDSSSDSGPDDMEPAPKAKSSSKKSGSSSSRGADNNTWTLERNRLVKINEFRGRVSVDIREHYEKDGQLLPGKKGISLNAKEWDKLKQIIPEIDKALKNY